MNKEKSRQTTKKIDKKLSVNFILLIGTIPIMFTGAVISCYILIFNFNDNILNPFKYLSPSVMVAFIVMLCSVLILKSLIKYKFGINVNIIPEFLISFSFFIFSIFFAFKIFLFTGLTSLMVVGISFYMITDELNFNAMFFINLSILFMASVFTYYFYTLSIVN